MRFRRGLSGPLQMLLKRLWSSLSCGNFSIRWGLRISDILYASGCLSLSFLPFFDCPTACDLQKTAMARMLPFTTDALRGQAFVPECQADGSFSRRQCNDPLGRNSTAKECWCVRNDGREIDGSRRLASASPVDCAKIGKCQINYFISSFSYNRNNL